MKKLIYIIITFLILNLSGIIYTSCVINSELYYKDIDIEFLNNSGDMPVVTELPNINHNYFGLRLNLLGNEYLSSNSNIGFINSCYATKKPIKYSKTEMINDIKIYSITDFNENISSSDCINDYFVARYHSDTTVIPVTIEQIISMINSNIVKDSYGLINEEIDLLLIKQPTVPLYTSFIIELNLDNGRTLTDTSDYVNIL